MRRVLLVLTIIVAALALAVPVAHAGSPHFVGTPTLNQTGDTLTATFKIAGLGNEDQTITLSGVVQCVNGGGNDPQADNKRSTIASEVFSPKNGNIVGSLSGDLGGIDPDCAPPMTLDARNLVLSVEPAGISYTFPA